MLSRIRQGITRGIPWLLGRGLAWVQGTSLRMRLVLGALVVLAAAIGGLGWATAQAAQETLREARALIDEAASLRVGQLLEPATYSRLAEQSAQTERATERLRSRLGLLRPLELVPFLGHRVRAARNTATVGLEVARATRLVVGAYGHAVEARRTGGLEALQAALAEHKEDLEQARDSLNRTRELLAKPLLLSDREAAILNGSVVALRTAALVAAESPRAVDDGLELLRGIFDLQQALEDPSSALLESEKVSQVTAEVRRRSLALAQEVRRLAQAVDAPQEILELVATGAGMVNAAAETVSALLGITDALDEGFLTPEFGETVGSLLAQAEDRLREAREQLTSLRASLSEGVGGELAEVGGFTDAAGGIFEPVETGLDQVESVITAVQELLGFSAPMTYLVVFQNQNEIRATGGFVGATVEAHVKLGTLERLVYDDSTFIDPPPLINNPPAPEPLFWYLWMGRLLFRDANWSPHFPASAEELTRLYERGRNAQIDGVVATTKVVGLDLVAALPGVTVPGVDGVLDRSLASQYMEGELDYPCTEGHVSERPKRCFDQDLFQAVLDRLQQGVTTDERDGLTRLLLDHLRRKNILLYTFSDRANEFIVASGWDGAVPSTSQDLLLVVDSSLPGHTTRFVSRSWDYDVSLVPGGQSVSQLRVRYQNDRPSGVADCRQAAEGGGGCYWNYFRFFLSRAAHDVTAAPVPLHEGSEKLIWGHRDPDSLRVLKHASAGLEGLTEVGGYVAVEPGSTLTIPVRYWLGPEVVQRVGRDRYEYRLLLVKQPGMERDDVRVRMQLPEGARLVTSSPAGMTMEEGVLEFRGLLEDDTEVVAVFETSTP